MPSDLKPYSPLQENCDPVFSYEKFSKNMIVTRSIQQPIQDSFINHIRPKKFKDKIDESEVKIAKSSKVTKTKVKRFDEFVEKSLDKIGQKNELKAKSQNKTREKSIVGKSLSQLGVERRKKDASPEKIIMKKKEDEKKRNDELRKEVNDELHRVLANYNKCLTKVNVELMVNKTVGAHDLEQFTQAVSKLDEFRNRHG